MDVTKWHYNIQYSSSSEGPMSDYKYCTRPIPIKYKSTSESESRYNETLRWLAFIGGVSKQPILKDRKRIICSISDFR